MSNKCLVTKLKGSVDNTDLPIFMAFRIDLKPLSGRGGDYCYAAIGSGNSPLTVTSKIPYHLAGGSASTAPVTIPANTIYPFGFFSNEVPEGATEEALVVSGDIYSMTAITFYDTANWFSIKKPDHTSMLYSSNLICDVCGPDEAVKPSVKVFTLNDTTIDGGNYAKVFEHADDLVYLLGVSIGGVKCLVNTADIAGCKNLKYVNTRVNGSVVDLPRSVISLWSPTSATHGNLEDFVEDRRNNGVTEGFLCIHNATTAWNMRYNNTRIINLDPSVMPTTGDTVHNTYFVWTASTMGFTSTKPAGFVDYSSPYPAAVAALNGEI